VRTFQDVQDVYEAFAEQGLPLRVLKLCPVTGVTPDYVAMLGGCYPGIKYCPTGEVTIETLAEWKASPHIAAPMGSGMVPKGDIVSGNWSEVRKRLSEIRSICRESMQKGSDNR
jgi:2-keto-3-deoxy-6-phosphogluconate aldolase